MFIIKTLTIFISAAISFNEAKFVDTLKKCSIQDNECQGKLFTSSILAVANTGISELGIPPVDPYEFKDVTVPILDLIEVIATEGTFKGAKNCVVEKYVTEIEKGHAEMTLACSHLLIKSKYKISGSNPVLKNLFIGDSIHGEGNGIVKIEKLKLYLDYFYDVEKNKDGDVFFNCKFNKTVYTYDILGKVSFDADNIILGETDGTKVVLEFMNENSKFIMNTFGKYFIDKALESIFHYLNIFFTKVPAKYYVQEDLSQYVKS